MGPVNVMFKSQITIFSFVIFSFFSLNIFFWCVAHACGWHWASCRVFFYARGCVWLVMGWRVSLPGGFPSPCRSLLMQHYQISRKKNKTLNSDMKARMCGVIHLHAASFFNVLSLHTILGGVVCWLENGDDGNND